MNILVATTCIVAALAAIAIVAMRANRKRLAIVAIALMFLQAVFIVTFGMGGIRAHVEQAKSKGASADFVEGMIDRSWFYFAPRIAVGITAFGLFVVSVVAVRRHRREEIAESADSPMMPSTD